MNGHHPGMCSSRLLRNEREQVKKRRYPRLNGDTCPINPESVRLKSAEVLLGEVAPETLPMWAATALATGARQR